MVAFAKYRDVGELEELAMCSISLLVEHPEEFVKRLAKIDDEMFKEFAKDLGMRVDGDGLGVDGDLDKDIVIEAIVRRWGAPKAAEWEKVSVYPDEVSLECKMITSKGNCCQLLLVRVCRKSSLTTIPSCRPQTLRATLALARFPSRALDYNTSPLTTTFYGTSTYSAWNPLLLFEPISKMPCDAFNLDLKTDRRFSAAGHEWV